MKTTKKILSIVLAVMLLVGTVVVGVSAESMVYEKAGSKLTYTATVAGKEANADGFIEVEPGETITVSVYAQANYYFGTTGSEIFCWTAGFFNTFTEENVTLHNFVNNYTPNKKVIASTSASQLGTGYNKGTHEGYLYGRTYSTDCTSPFDASTAALGYTFTFTVPESAVIGATGEFLMPETCSATVATTSRQRQIYASVNGSATDYNSGTVVSIYPETIDLTGTILNFKVVSAEAPEVPCDYTKLEAALDLEPEYEEEYYDADKWAAYEAALEAADAIDRDMIVDAAGENQKAIDAAAKALTDAYNALVAKFVDRSALADALALTPDYDEECYTVDSWAAWENAVADGTDTYEGLDGEPDVDWAREEVAAAVEAIEDALAALELKAADYSAVDAAKDAAAAIDASKYTAASVKAVNDAVAAVVEDLDITKQAQVDAMAKAINDAIANLAPLGACDYAALDAAIARKEALNAADWTPASWTESGVDAAYAAAKAIARNLLADEAGANQKSIDDAAAALNAAIDALKPVADKAALAAAIARISALKEDDYTPESWEAADIDSAILVAEEVYANADAPQTIVDGMVSAIERAEAKLVKKADKAALAEALEAAKDLDEADWTPESWAAADFEAVIAASQAVYDDPNASDAEVAEAIDALVNAAAKLVEKADKTALKAAIDTLPEVAEDEATSETWAAYEEELAKANRVYADDNATQDAVNAAEANLLAAIAGVKALGNCDYTALDAAIATTPEYSAEYYDAEEYAAYEAALAAAKAVERDMLDDEAGVNQAKIDDAAEALVNAYNALDARFVDLSALESALALTPEYGAEYYDAAAYAAWQDAVAEGRETYEGLEGEPDVDWARKEVADAADAITAAFRKLEPAFIDYSALEEAVAAYGETPKEADDYTPATYEPYAAALERAQNMLNDKDENAPASDTQLQAAIDAAAAELESTFNGLELKPEEPPVDPEPALTIVTAVRSTEEFYEVGDTVNFEFDCAITNVTKLQIVFANGSTLTYHRAHSSVVSIVDNGDGTETWTIAVKIYYAEADAAARGKLGSVWEDEGCAFKYETKAKPVAEDYAVKSAVVLLSDAAVTEFTANETVVLKIVCGPDTLRMRLVNQNDGGTSTYDRSRATQDENGNWVWLITYKYPAGTYAFDIHTAGSSNRLADANEDLVFTAKAYVPYVGPSTGNDADIVVSAEVAKARLVRGDVQTFTIVTDKNAWGVRVLDENGSVLTYSKDASTATDNGDGTLTWTLTTTCNVAGTYNCKVDAIYGSSWMNNGTTVSYRVVY